MQYTFGRIENEIANCESEDRCDATIDVEDLVWVVAEIKQLQVELDNLWDVVQRSYDAAGETRRVLGEAGLKTKLRKGD